MTRPSPPTDLAALHAHMLGDGPAVIMASRDDIRALLAYVAALEATVSIAPLVPERFEDVERRAREAGL